MEAWGGCTADCMAASTVVLEDLVYMGASVVWEVVWEVSTVLVLDGEGRNASILGGENSGSLILSLPLINFR